MNQSPATLVPGILVIALAVYAVSRRVDVRLALTLAALALGVLAGDVTVIVRTFLKTLSNEQFVVPICTAMGFAYVLRHTGCDKHLVHLLIRPIQRVRLLLIPGTVVVGCLVNVPIISQASTVVTIGPVLIPLLRAARISAVTTGAALLLGASIGGELLNPGAPELQTVSKDGNATPQACIGRVAVLLPVHLAVTTAAFWLLSLRAEARPTSDQAPLPDVFDSQEAGQTRLPVRDSSRLAAHRESLSAPQAAEAQVGSPVREGFAPPEEEAGDFQVNYFKAGVPLVPLALLFLTGPPLNLLPVERSWLVAADEPATLRPDSRLIGAAMLIGVGVAALTAGRTIGGVGRAFFDGTAYAFANIISVIVSASCFGEGVKAIGLAKMLGDLTAALPGLLGPLAMALPWGFALVSGSGMASTQSLFGFFVEPAQRLGCDVASVGALVSLSAAAGRTMSPVAAVVLLCAALTDTQPLALARRVTGPLLLGLLAMGVVWHFLPP
jgi:DcuC family C4-dicarboxylate transporter